MILFQTIVFIFFFDRNAVNAERQWRLRTRTPRLALCGPADRNAVNAERQWRQVATERLPTPELEDRNAVNAERQWRPHTFVGGLLSARSDRNAVNAERQWRRTNPQAQISSRVMTGTR